MKNLIIIVFAAILIGVGGCMKNYENDVVPEVDDSFFQLKTGKEATIVGDTAYAVPNVYIRFWVDSLPESSNNYSYAWNLGDGTTSVSESPEHKYAIGTYDVSVIITKISNNQTIQRSITLAIRPSALFDKTILVIEASPVTGGNYNYKLGFETSVIYNYNNTTAPRWVTGTFTNWNQVVISEVALINGLEYLLYNLVLPTHYTDTVEFSYGRGNNWAYAPNSPWFDGIFRGYFTNGQGSPYPIPYTYLPGDGGDIHASTPATIRTQIIGQNLRVFINYGFYAPGPSPFICSLTTNNWINTELIPSENGWGYKDFPIYTLPQGMLIWKFGGDINSPNVLSDMSKSKYFMQADNMLVLQVISLKSGIYEIKTL